MRIAFLDHSKRFVALSYLWPTGEFNNQFGQLQKANRPALEAVNGLTQISLPTVISDAIALCKELDERYLWVDRLCIIQDDEEESKHEQIRRMDIIYNSATFTIVAALNDPNTTGGLPGCPEIQGCPGRPRLPSTLAPATTQIHKGVSAAISQLVDPSLWNTRGWTLQERYLSRRRLYITDFQTMFQCICGTAYEEMSYVPLSPDVAPTLPGPEPAQVSLFSHSLEGRASNKSDSENEDHTNAHLQLQHLKLRGFRQASQGEDIASVNIMPQNYRNYLDPSIITFDDYIFAVEVYVSRQLSRKSDILNAFNGVGNLLGRGLGTDMIFGLPEKYLHIALGWYTIYPSEGEDSHKTADSPQGWIPSWSWASIKTPQSVHFNKYYENIVSLIDFFRYCSADSGKEGYLKRVLAKHGNVDKPEEEVPLYRLFALPTPLIISQTACHVASRIPGSLLFNTFIFSCLLSSSADGIVGSHHLWDPTGGETVGKVWDPSHEWIAARNDHLAARIEVSLVVIAGDRQNFRTGGAQLDVLLVDSHPQEPLAFRRIGLGLIGVRTLKDLDLWRSCKPRWESIVLC